MSLPLLDAASVSARLTLPQLMGLLGVTVALHVFISIENDVVDLPLDRTHPDRAEYPLVKGTIRRRQALVIALLQIPIALALTVLQGGGVWAYAAVGLSVVMMTIYNVWGKRASFPPLTDVAQGIGFGALSWYGAAIVGNPTRLTLIVFASVVTWMALVNLLGGLRDLTNDLNSGMRTTPILLGARPTHTGQTHPRRMRVYACCVQALLIGLAALALIDNEFGYGPAVWAGVAVVALWLGFAALRLLAAFSEVAHDYPTMLAVGRLQMLASSGSILVLFVPHLDAGLLLALLIVYRLASREYDPRPALRYLRRGQLVSQNDE
ncbi:MAG: UbiA prenyltransferase family protein [Anaerolineae bacterium]